MIISSGFTIGAQEVEECLRTHPAVEQAAVIAVTDPSRGHAPKAFVQLRQNQAVEAPSVAQLQDHVRNKLGRYTYPRDVVFVDQFTVNEAGKIQKKMLS